MKHKRFWVATAIIACIVFIGFMLSVPHTRDAARIAASQNKAVIPAVSLRDSFKKGIHTITGTIEVPNACTTATANSILSGDASSTQKILVQISMPADAGICLQTPTKINFSTTISAAAHLPISATINGAEASTTAL